MVINVNSMAFFKKNLLLIILLAIGAATFIKGIIFLDPDFGWHLKMGELILQKGIPLTDPFSYTMPSYHFVDHEWLANIFFSIGIKTIGIYGLSLIFALIFTVSLFLAIPGKIKNYVYLPLVLAAGAMLGFAGIRTQVITWFFLAFLLKILFSEKLWKKWRFFIPLIFLFWANLHAGFAAGIAVLGLVLIFKSVQNRRIEISNLLVVVISFLATFINPYGIGLWHEVWMVFSDSFARWHIMEWAPGFFDTDFSLLALFTLSVSFILKYRTKIGGLQILIYFFLLLMALSSLRHIPLWVISAIFITSEGIRLLIAEVGKNKAGVLRLNLLKKILLVSVFLVFICEVVINLYSSYNFSEQKYYPVKAVMYLNKQNFTDGNLFTSYNYGGYLIWKLPGKKVFIDGRMASWRGQGNYPGESNYVFKDYFKMLSNESYFKQMVKKYNIHYILLPAPVPQDNKIPSFIVKLRSLAQKLVLFKTNEKVIDTDIAKMGLKKIYNDGYFVIYKI
jgi:hypothetical protein